MAISSVREAYEAYDLGRWHHQRFYKTAGLAGDSQWQDWSYSAGQPGVNARVGNAGEFNPYVAVNNNAIYFPGIESGMERRLADLCIVSTAGGASQVACAFTLYDLLGVYPLIDGDSYDAQPLDNLVPLPRYATGAGVVPVLVNHVAAQLGAGAGTYTYTSCSGEQKTVAFGVSNVGLGKSGSSSSLTATTGSLGMPRGGGCGGARAINELTFTTPPSGLWAIYMIKPLAHIRNDDGTGVGAKIATEKNFMMSGGHLPLILDGAHLGFFYLPSGGSRTVFISGHATFIWG